jgi:hypothetical protein
MIGSRSDKKLRCSQKKSCKMYDNYDEVLENDLIEQAKIMSAVRKSISEKRIIKV